MKDFRDEFYRYITLFQEREPLAFARYGDGELLLIKGKEVANYTQAAVDDKWTAPEKMTKLGLALQESLLHTEANYHYAIPCRCCQPCNIPNQQYLLSHIKQSMDNLTFANLFINGNYPLWKNYLESMGQHVILIANIDGMNNDLFPLYVDGYFPLSDDCVNFYEEHGEDFIEGMIEGFKNIKGQLVFVSGGPLAKVIIHKLFTANPTNRYVDVGSSIDEIIHRRATRPFMNPNSQYYKRVCIF